MPLSLNFEIRKCCCKLLARLNDRRQQASKFIAEVKRQQPTLSCQPLPEAVAGGPGKLCIGLRRQEVRRGSSFIPFVNSIE